MLIFLGQNIPFFQVIWENLHLWQVSLKQRHANAVIRMNEALNAMQPVYVGVP